MKQCPTPSEIERFISEELSEEARARIAGHLNACDSCFHVLEGRTEDADTVRWRQLQTASVLDRQVGTESTPEADDRDEHSGLGFLLRLAETQPHDPNGSTATVEGTWPMVPGYEMVEVLGRGGMGIVYKAKDIQLNRVVALKMMQNSEAARPEQRERFLREARAIASLKHPNIVQIHEIGEVEGKPFFSLDYETGGSLAQRLNGTPWSADKAALLVQVLAQAVEAAHQQNIIHRDLKPANVLFSADDTPKITDFGLAKRLDTETEQTKAGMIVGTPSYMAPEQADNSRRALGPATDIYSLGVILYELLTGRPPFKAATSFDTVLQVLHDEPVPPSLLQSKVPRDLETICLKCLAKESHKRYHTASSLADDLRRFLNREPILARTIGRVERLIRWSQRQPMVAGLSAAILVLSIFAFAMVTWKWRESIASSEKLSKALEQEKAALDKEKQARAEQQQTAYFDKIAAANAEFFTSNLREATALLDECPKELRGWEWYYLNRLCRGAPLTCGRHGDARSGIAFRPDGMVIASVGKYHFWLHEAQTGQLLRRWPNDLGADASLCWEAKGKWLAAAGEKNLHLHDPKTGALLSKLEGHMTGIWVVASSPQGRLLASGDLDGQLIIWDASAARKIHAIRAHDDRVSGLAFHPDGDFLASASHDGTIKIWNVAAGTELRTLRGHKHAVAGVTWSPCGQWIVSTSSALDGRRGEPGSIKMWKAATGEEMSEVKYATGYVGQLSFRSDGKQLAAGCFIGARRWTLPGLQEMSPIRVNSIRGISYSADGRCLATLDNSGTIKVWDPENGQEPFDARRSPHNSVFAMSPHPTKRIVACGDGSGVVEVIDLTARRVMQTWYQQPNEPIFAITWNAEGTMVAAGREKKPILLCRVGEDNCQVIEGHRARVYGIAFSPDGKRLVSAGDEKTIKVWNVATGKEIHQFATVQTRLLALAMDAQGKFVAAAEPEGPIRLWDLESRELYGEFQGNPPGVCACLAFHPDGTHLAAGGPTSTNVIHIWNVATRKEIVQCRGHKQKVTGVGWSPDGKRLVSSSDDGTVRLWEPKSGRLLLTLRGHKGATTAAAFTADGQLLISTGWDGTVRVWDATPVEETGS